MYQPAGKVESALHAAGIMFDSFFGAILESCKLQHFWRYEVLI